MQYETAAEWYLFAKDRNAAPSHPFLQFISLWVAFNALYAFKSAKGGNRFRDPEPEWDQIERFIHSPQIQSAHRRALEQPGSTYSRAIRRIEEISAMTGGAQARVLQRDRESADAVVRAVYIIRCKLFHGRKRPGDMWDKQIVDAASTILEALIQPFVRPAKAAI